VASRTPFDVALIQAPTGTAAPNTGTPWRNYVAILVVLDTVSMVGAAFVAQAARFGTLGLAPASTAGVPYLLLGGAMALAWLGLLALGGSYERRYLGTGSEEYRRVLSGAARLLAVVAILAFVLELDIARAFVAVTIALGGAGTMLERYGLRRWLHGQRAKGRFLRQALVVGSEASVREFAQRARRSSYTGVAVWGVCLPERSGGFVDADGVQLPVLGSTEDLLGLVQCSAVDTVVVADATALSVEGLRQLAWQVEGTGVSLLVAPEVTDVAGPLVASRPQPGLPVLTVEEPELGGVRHFLKEAFDRAFAALALLVLLPGLVVIGVLVRLTSPGPAIFKQVRVGLRGRRFVLWKFRTMTVDAEERRSELAERNELDGVLFKIRDDPRVTPFGRILRRWSIDELPQLWNVVCGQMSIVGPRPPLPGEVENYSHRVRRRLLVKPGLTGLWQISGRSGLAWEESVRLDLHYIEHWSPALDLAILAKTVSAVVRGDGAY
jgi:exopolysaccharide biosynthesis polyprenyl glycosylphosphotransferase